MTIRTWWSRHVTLLGLGFLACLAPIPAQARDRALVVGVNRYPGITVGGLAGQKDLGGAVFDAKTFQTLLTTRFGVADDDIHTLFEADASRDHILGEIRGWLIGGTAPGDRVFFYFAGHGAAVRVQDDATGASRMTSAIVPADAHGDLTQQPLAIEGMILGVEMRGLLDQLTGRRVTVVADSCQSGSVSRDASHPFVVPPSVRVRTLTPSGAVGMTEAAFSQNTEMRLDAKRNSRLLAIEPATSSGTALAVWSAATTDQVTFDLPDRPGGIFTQSFADGLRDGKAVADGQGQITAAALLNFVRDRAQVFCGGAGPACSAGLTPQLVAPPDYLTKGLGASSAATTPSEDGKAMSDKLNAVLSHHNDFSLDVHLLPGTALRLGEVIHIQVTSGEAGKVAVFDLTPDGDLTQLFPNAKTDRAGRIRANAPLTMPDAFWGIALKATPPAGKGALLVLVTEDGVDLGQATGLSANFKPIASSSRLLEVIGAAVEQPVVSAKLDEPTRAARWAFVRVPYSIDP